MKKLLLSSLILVLLSVSLFADAQSTVANSFAIVNSFTAERIGPCIAIHYSDAKSKKDLYDFITIAKISSIKLLVNEAGGTYIRIKSEDETNDYLFLKDDRKNVLLALQSLVNAAYAGHTSSAKDKLDLFINR